MIHAPAQTFTVTGLRVRVRASCVCATYLSLGDGVEERTVYNPHGERIGKEEEEMRTDVNVEIIEVRAHVWFSVHNTTVTIPTTS